MQSHEPDEDREEGPKRHNRRAENDCRVEEAVAFDHDVSHGDRRECERHQVRDVLKEPGHSLDRPKHA